MSKKVYLFLTAILVQQLNAQTPPTLPATSPTTLAMVYGYENSGNTITDDIWYVPYRDYTLTRVKLFKDDDYATGFDATFSAPASYSGWPDYTHRFGTNAATDEQESRSFSEEITDVFLCVDQSNGNSADFEGFKFRNVDNNLRELNTDDCNQFT